MKPRRIKKKTKQLSALIRADLYDAANDLRLKNAHTWPQVLEEILADYVTRFKIREEKRKRAS